MAGRSLPETQSWAVAAVISVIVAIGIGFHVALKQLWKWLERTKKKALLSALEKIMDELMLVGLMSLLMGHWIEYAAKICVKSSALSEKFYICGSEGGLAKRKLIVSSHDMNTTLFEEQESNKESRYCPKGRTSFASAESLEQLHRFMFALVMIHVSYSFVTIALATIKIDSWRTWESHAKEMATEYGQDTREGTPGGLKRLTTFVRHRTLHPWSHNRVLVWLLCLSRQFWSSVARSDYLALRFGFITTHQLPLTYDFHSYMLRSMEEEFRYVVGISIPLWIYTILCIFLEFHDTYAYFWLSFVPAILIVAIGTKLHRVMVKLAVEVNKVPSATFNQLNLRDDLFWFGKPKFLLWLIHLISFQNAFEMSTFVWSMWETGESGCFMENHIFMVLRLLFGVVAQVWCSHITFPLYVIVTQMGSRFKRSLISENVRRSLAQWQKRVRQRRSSSQRLSSAALLKSESSSSWNSSNSPVSPFNSSDSMVPLWTLFSDEFPPFDDDEDRTEF